MDKCHISYLLKIARTNGWNIRWWLCYRITQWSQKKEEDKTNTSFMSNRELIEQFYCNRIVLVGLFFLFWLCRWFDWISNSILQYVKFGVTMAISNAVTTFYNSYSLLDSNVMSWYFKSKLEHRIDWKQCARVLIAVHFYLHVKFYFN